MIVRDEELFLGECLASIQPFVDEIVVVDTGSQDNTKAIAREYGARVSDFVWHDDFAAARNCAIDQATGDWILYIDADERLGNTDPAYLQAQLADRGKISHQVRFFPFVNCTGYWENRLFRNDPRLRFRSVIHEGMQGEIIRIATEDGLEIGRTDITIEHVGYEGDQTRKHRRNLPLLQRAINADPDRAFLRSHLGRVLAGLGDDDGAIAAWQAGIDITRAGRDERPGQALSFLDLIPFLHEREHDVSALVADTRSRFPDNMLGIWLAARVAIDTGDLDGAVDLLEQLAAIDGDTYFDGKMAYDKKIFGVFAYESLGNCYFKLGRHADSARYFRLAEVCEPEEPGHRVRRQLAEQRAAAAGHQA